MKFLFLFFTFLLFSLVRAQTQRILILDSLSGNPVADAEVQTQWGSLFSDYKGEIEFEFELTGDYIIFSHPSYITKYVVFSEKLDTILLVIKPHQLVEVAVKPNIHHDFFELGYYHTKKLYQIKCGLHVNSPMAVLIRAPAEKVYIDEILLHIKSKQTKQYNVYLYKPDKLDMPGEIIYKRTITVDSLKKEGVINIHDLFIKMPKNGIFIGLENLESYDLENPPIRFYSLEDYSQLNITYITRNDIEINPDGVWIPLEGSLGGPDYIPCFGLKVYQK